VIEVMVARGDEDGGGNVRQGAGQGPDGLGVDPLPVKQVAGQQDQVHLFLPRQPGQTGGNVPQFLAALGGLSGRELAEGGIQMKIGSVKQFQTQPSSGDIGPVDPGAAARGGVNVE